MPVQELEGPLPIDRVSAVEKLDRRPVAEPELIIEPPRLGILRRHPWIERHAVMMPALDHEGPRKDQVTQLGVAEGIAHVETGDFPLVGEHEALPVMSGGELARPVVEIS